MKFYKLREQDLELILKWRTQPEVTRYMYSDVEHDMEKQVAWFKKVMSDESSRHWIIEYQGNPIGVINLADIDLRNKRCSLGYYIGESEHRIIGGLIPPYLYNYVFNELELNKIVAEIMEGNDNVMRLHEMHGYRLVGKYENHVFKYDEYHGVYVYELLAETWRSMTKYRKLVARFDGY